MDYKEFLKRLNIQSICNFLLYGDEYVDGVNLDNRTLTERLEAYNKCYMEELRTFQEDVLETGRASLDEARTEIDLENMTEKIIVAIGNSEDVYFELGLIAGLEIAMNFFGLIFVG